VRDELHGGFKSRSLAEWEDELGEKDVMIGRVNTPREALDDPHLRNRSFVDTSGDGFPSIGYPAEARSEFDRTTGDAPRLGEHTTEVLGRFGFDDDEVEALVESGVAGKSEK